MNEGKMHCYVCVCVEINGVDLAMNLMRLYLMTIKDMNKLKFENEYMYNICIVYRYNDFSFYKG